MGVRGAGDALHSMERAVVHEPHHLQDSKQIPFAFFDIGALIPMAAVFDV